MLIRRLIGGPKKLRGVHCCSDSSEDDSPASIEMFYDNERTKLACLYYPIGTEINNQGQTVFLYQFVGREDDEWNNQSALTKLIFKR